MDFGLRKWLLVIVAVLALAVGATWLSLDKDMRALVGSLPTNRDLLFWSTPQRDAAFRVLDRMPVLAKSNIIQSGDQVYALPQGAPLALTGIDAFMTAQRSAALIIVHNGQIRFERYGLGFSKEGRWTSFSVAKSLTSTLIGAAIKDGYIKSIDDKVTAYIPEMRGSAYDDVSIAQLLTMTSGVRWNEDYADPKSDVALFNEHVAEPGIDATASYMRKLPRAAPAGTKWLYNTGETNLIGLLVSKATKQNLADYLSKKIWVPFGMQQDASWILSSTGHEIGGCCIQAATRDMARFGQFMLNGGVINGQSILPEGWIAAATSKQQETGESGQGYGYQWWTSEDGSFAAQGIFGQGIFIDPKRNLVIASNANWPTASSSDPKGVEAQREAFYRSVQAALDAEN